MSYKYIKTIVMNIFFLLIYDRNPILNSHARIFWGFRGSNPRSHKGLELSGE